MKNTSTEILDAKILSTFYCENDQIILINNCFEFFVTAWTWKGLAGLGWDVQCKG